MKSLLEEKLFSHYSNNGPVRSEFPDLDPERIVPNIVRRFRYEKILSDVIKWVHLPDGHFVRIPTGSKPPPPQKLDCYGQDRANGVSASSMS